MACGTPRGGNQPASGTVVVLWDPLPRVGVGRGCCGQSGHTVSKLYEAATRAAVAFGAALGLACGEAPATSFCECRSASRSRPSVPIRAAGATQRRARAKASCQGTPRRTHAHRRCRRWPRTAAGTSPCRGQHRRTCVSHSIPRRAAGQARSRIAGRQPPLTRARS